MRKLERNLYCLRLKKMGLLSICPDRHATNTHCSNRYQVDPSVLRNGIIANFWYNRNMKMKEIQNKNRDIVFKLRKKFIILFILLTSLAFFFVNYIEQEITKSYLKQTTQNYERAYNTIYTQYKELGDVVFTGLLKLGEIKKKFKNIENSSKEEQAQIRKSLYKKNIER